MALEEGNHSFCAADPSLRQTGGNHRVSGPAKRFIPIRRQTRNRIFPQKDIDQSGERDEEMKMRNGGGQGVHVLAGMWIYMY